MKCIDLAYAHSSVRILNAMSVSIHILQKFNQDWIDRLKARLPDTISLTHGDRLPTPARYSILVAGVPNREHLMASPELTTLIIPWSGLPKATRELLKEFPQLDVHNIHHNAAPAAETAVTLMMAAAKNIVPIDRTLRTGDWSPRYDYDSGSPSGPIMLRGKTTLVLGYGAIGKEIASLCHGMGMRVIGIRKNIPSYSDSPFEIYTCDALKKLLPRANVLFVCLPLTPETERLIGEEELELLPDQAIIVNISRGAIIDEKALYHALIGPRSLRAGLDVWYSYPRDEATRVNTLPSEYPFHQLDNIVMTPHLGGHSDQTETLRISALAELLTLAAEGKPLPNRIDPARGY